MQFTYINGVRCEIGEERYNSCPISCQTHNIGRVINGKPCSCSVAWATDRGTCPCAPKDFSNPLVATPK